jgi:hypothetical protein
MEAMRQSWTDDRLDNLNRKVDERFDRVDERIDRADRETNRRFDETDRRLIAIEGDVKEMRSEMTGRLDSIGRSMVYLAVGLTTAMLAGFASITTLIATQI